MEYSEPPFVGPHIGIVQTLLDHYDQLTQGPSDGHRVVLLRSHSGMGKSRIVREFYGELQKRQLEPMFWPKLSLSSTSMDGFINPLATRKILGPKIDNLVWPEDALPSFGWWSFECLRSYTGEGINLIPQAQQDLKTLLLPMSLAKADALSIWQKVRETRTGVFHEAREAFVDEAVDTAIDRLQDVLNLAIPGIGSLAKWGWKTKKSIEEYSRNQVDLSSRVDLSERAENNASTAAKELAESFFALSHEKIPWVVAIEDAHAMSPELGELLHELARPSQKHPILVILTAWPEGELHPTWQKWLMKAQKLDRVSIIDVPDLEAASLTTILKSYAPRVSVEDATRIVEAMTSPLMLTMWLTTEAIQRRIRRLGGALVLDDGPIETPSSLQEIYLQRWRELPLNAQRALAAAVELSSKSNLLPSFLPNVVVKAAQVAQILEVGEGLDFAQNTAGWTVSHGVAQVFREEKLAWLAKRAGIIDSYDVEILRGSAITILRNMLDELRQDYFIERNRKSSFIAAWLLELIGTPTPARCDVAAAWLHAHDLAERQEFAIASELLSSAIRYTDEGELEQLIMRRQSALWLGRSGEYKTSASLLNGVLDDEMRLLGPNHPETLTTQYHLILLDADRGAPETAQSKLYRLLKHQIQELGPDNLSTLITRDTYVTLEARAGGNRWAISEFRDLLEDEIRVLGPDHPRTLATRLNMIICLSRLVERTGYATEQFRDLLKDQIRVLGPDHPNTHATRHIMATFFSNARGRTGAIDDFRDLLEDEIRLLGPDHPTTLTLRRLFATFIAKSQGANIAIVEFRDLLKDEIRVLGPNDPETLATQKELSFRSAEAVKDKDQINELRGFLRKKTQILGPDHLTIFIARKELAILLARIGETTTAMNEFRDLLKDEIRVLGPDHPTTRMTRDNLTTLLKRPEFGGDIG